MIEKMGPRHIAEVVAVHRSCFPIHTNRMLGLAFLPLYVLSICADSVGISFIALEQHGYPPPTHQPHTPFMVTPV